MTIHAKRFDVEPELTVKVLKKGFQIYADAVARRRSHFAAVAIEVQNRAVGHEGNVLPLVQRQGIMRLSQFNAFSVALVDMDEQVAVTLI